ncbi:MAG: hypothetical protein U0556_02905 [Dehalococcoidia bacterium]
MKDETTVQEQTTVHQISASLIRPAPAEIDAGMTRALNLRVSCNSGCDLRGKSVRIMEEGVVLADGLQLSEFDETSCQTGEFLIVAPAIPGEHNLKAVFPPQEEQGALHVESTVPCSVVVKSHTSSLVVWGMPAPVVRSAKFSFKVGVNCSSGCDLAGKKVEIHDHEGALVTTGVLGDASDPELPALYVAEMETVAPDTEGRHEWAARFLEPEMALPHTGSTFGFGFATVKPADHTVTVEVINKETNTPIQDAEVYFAQSGPSFRGRTDEHGMLTIGLPKGEYELTVSASDRMPKGIPYEYLGDTITTRGGEYKHYIPENNMDSREDFRRTITLDGDRVLKVELVGAIEPLQIDLDYRFR